MQQKHHKKPEKKRVLETASAKGVTLIELLLVVAIMSTLGVASTAFYSRTLTQNAVANTADQLANSFRKAQMYTMMGKQNSKWGVNYTNHTITLFKGDTLGQDPAFNETFSVQNNISVSGFTELTFAKVTGVPSNTPTITITGNNTTRSMTLNNQGIVNRN